MPITSNRLFAATLIFACMLPLALLAYVATEAATTAAQKQARGRVDASAAGGAEYVTEQVQGFGRLIESYARRSSLEDAIIARSATGGRSPQLDEQLHELVGSRIGIHVVAFLDTRGIVRSVEPFDAQVVGGDFSRRDYFHGAMARQGTYASEAYRSRSLDQPLVVSVATVVHGPRGQVLGVLVAALSFSETQRFVEEFASAQGVELTVTDQRGVAIANDGRAPESLAPRRHDPRVTRALAGEHGIIEYDDGKTRELSAYRPLPQLGWTVSASIPAATVSHEVARLRTLVLGSAALLALMLVLGLAWWLRTVGSYDRGIHEKVDELEHANQQLAMTNRTLDAFSHTLAHDLRSPLSTIGGFAQALRKVARGDERLELMSSHIEESTRRMDRMISDVLELATLARAHPERTILDPATIIREAAADVPELELELGTLPDQVAANTSLLYRSFKNLLENARAYGHAPDEPTRVHITGDETEQEWTFWIDDAGPGIPAADRTRIFLAFQRGGDPRDRPGTGLGLAIVAACAEAHGGSVSVEDSPTGGGARFRLTIGKPGPDEVPPAAS